MAGRREFIALEPPAIGAPGPQREELRWGPLRTPLKGAFRSHTMPEAQSAKCPAEGRNPDWSVPLLRCLSDRLSPEARLAAGDA